VYADKAPSAMVATIPPDRPAIKKAAGRENEPAPTAHFIILSIAADSPSVC